MRIQWHDQKLYKRRPPIGASPPSASIRTEKSTPSYSGHTTTHHQVTSQRRPPRIIGAFPPSASIRTEKSTPSYLGHTTAHHQVTSNDALPKLLARPIPETGDMAYLLLRSPYRLGGKQKEKRGWAFVGMARGDYSLHAIPLRVNALHFSFPFPFPFPFPLVFGPVSLPRPPFLYFHLPIPHSLPFPPPPLPIPHSLPFPPPPLPFPPSPPHQAHSQPFPAHSLTRSNPLIPNKQKKTPPPREKI